MSKKIILTGGGTAGHVIPNIAIIPKLKEIGYDIVYIGSRTGIEKELIQAHKIKYYGISTGKLRRYFDMNNFKDPFRIVKGVFEVVKIMRDEKETVPGRAAAGTQTKEECICRKRKSGSSKRCWWQTVEKSRFVYTVH